MKIREVAPEVDTGALLAGAQFVDAYRVALDGTTLDARKAAVKIFASGPRWIEVLLRLRNTDVEVVEAVVDLVTTQYHPLAKIAKDVAAGAVLVTAIGAASAGVLIIGPPLWRVLNL